MSSAVTISNEKITTREEELVKAILRSKDTLQATIPDDMPAGDIVANLRLCSSLIGKMERGRGQILAVLGRLMAMARRNKDVLSRSGHATIAELETELTTKYGLSRTALWDAKMIAERVPNLSVDRYTRIGSTNLLLLAKVTAKDSGGPKESLLNKAEEMPCEQFQAYLEGKGHLEQGGSAGATLTLKGSQARIRDLQRWLKRKEIRAAAESEDPLTIVLAATEEVESEWSVKGEQALKEQAG